MARLCIWHSHLLGFSEYRAAKFNKGNVQTVESETAKVERGKDYLIMSDKQVVGFPIKTVSELNRRDHWAVKNKRKKEQQFLFENLWKMSKVRVDLPCVITFTRYSCRTLDTDNLASAYKGLRDSLARIIGVDDGSDLITWKYEQEKISKRQHYFTVTVSDF